jgi:hypothetical protein
MKRNNYQKSKIVLKNKNQLYISSRRILLWNSYPNILSYCIPPKYKLLQFYSMVFCIIITVLKSEVTRGNMSVSDPSPPTPGCSHQAYGHGSNRLVRFQDKTSTHTSWQYRHKWLTHGLHNERYRDSQCAPQPTETETETRSRK